MYTDFVQLVKEQFPGKGFIALHEPLFVGNERKYVLDAIDSTFVSSVGAYVDKFEEMMKKLTGAKYAIATVNGTAALHTALVIAGVGKGDEVITQALSFIATSNAIAYTGADAVYLDVDKTDSLGLSPVSLKEFLVNYAEVKEKSCYNKKTGKRIAACVPMHTFGFPVQIAEIVEICDQYNIPVIEDAAESLGSYVGDKHTGTFGTMGVFSFNGNKTVTCGGGGCIVTNDEALGKLAKHITTTAKVPHKWEYVHDMVGYNYRMPNLNAAMACAQLEQLELFLQKKRQLANNYQSFFANSPISFYKEFQGTTANYWLNTIILEDRTERDAFLDFTNSNKVMTRPIWELSSNLQMFSNSYNDGLENSKWLADRVVNIPSSVQL